MKYKMVNDENGEARLMVEAFADATVEDYKKISRALDGCACGKCGGCFLRDSENYEVDCFDVLKMMGAKAIRKLYAKAEG